MQRFDAPLTAEDQKLSRLITCIMLIAYSAVALMLIAGVAAHIALKTPTHANAPAEVANKPEAPVVHRK
jgi:hypothetical protein